MGQRGIIGRRISCAKFQEIAHKRYPILLPNPPPPRNGDVAGQAAKSHIPCRVSPGEYGVFKKKQLRTNTPPSSWQGTSHKRSFSNLSLRVRFPASFWVGRPSLEQCSIATCLLQIHGHLRPEQNPRKCSKIIPDGMCS